MPSMEWIWLAALIVFAIAEAATTALVSIWFIGGSLAALIAALCGAELWLQILLFILVSAAMLLCLRPLARKYLTPKRTPTNADRNIGKNAVVTETIEPLLGKGAVKIGGVEWSAKSVDGAVIAAGSIVRIVGIEGAKVRVEPTEITQEQKEVLFK